MIESAPLEPICALARLEALDGGGYAWMLLELLLVVLLVGFVAWLALRTLSSRRFGDSGPIQVLARQTIAPRTAIYLISVGKRVLVVGSSDGQLSTLAELDEAELEGLDLEPDTESSFAARLQAAFSQRKASVSPHRDGEDEPGE